MYLLSSQLIVSSVHSLSFECAGTLPVLQGCLGFSVYIAIICSLHNAHTPSTTPSPSSPQQPLKSPSPNCSRSFLRDVTNDLNVTQGKKRVFNLSSAPGNNAGQRGLRGKGRGRANRKKVSPLPTTNCSNVVVYMV